MKKLLLLSFLLFPLLSFSQSFSNPESVEYDTANQRWLVGNNNSGEVLAYSPSSGTLTMFCSGMTNGPYGIEILGNVLYCCDGARVKGYNLTTGTQVFNVNLSASFLNGITSDGVNNLFVTDYTAKKIYRVNVTTNAFNVMASTSPKSPNGIIYDGANNRCVFATWGANAPIQALSLADSTITTLVTTTLGSLDGIIRDAQGNWYVSSWGNNSLNKFDPTFSSASTVVMSGLSQPADLGINAAGDSIGIPNSSGVSTVVFYAVPAGCTAPVTNSAIFSVECFGEASGGVALFTTAGTSPFTFQWSNGSTDQNLIDVPAGNYSFTVTDSLGCTYSSYETVQQPEALTTALVVTPDNQGSPNCNGSITTSASGGTSPYTYTWSNGITAFNNLCEGWYVVTVTDDNSCAITDSIYVDFSSSVSKLISTNNLTLIPNPSDDITTVRIIKPLVNGSIALVDVTGRVCFTQTINGNEILLHRNNLAQGCYQLTVKDSSGNIIQTQKLVYR